MSVSSAGIRVPGMLTPWGEAVTDVNAWRDYPRPQQVRESWTCLNGAWRYAITKIDATRDFPMTWEGTIRVPFAIESALSGVGRALEPDEFLWYRRTFDVKKNPGERILLHFESVDFRAQVFVGHQEVGVPHESSAVPFTLDITDATTDGTNVLTVCVWDPTDSGPYGSTGKQGLRPVGCFYSRASGIIGSVWLEAVPTTHVTDYRVTPRLDAGEVEFLVRASTAREPQCRVTVFDGTNAVATASGWVGEPFAVTLPRDFRRWSPESPFLYSVEIALGADRVRGYFGMRSFESRTDSHGIRRFFLNGRPYFVKGTLDQGWWPDGLLTPPSVDAIDFEIRTLKACGFNAVRKHIKVESRQYYARCDRLGILVLQDMPSDPFPSDGNARNAAPDGGRATDTWRYGFARRDLARMMAALYNVPSLVMWIPYNETWGQPGAFLTHTTLDWVRMADPTRLVDGPSGWSDWEGGTVCLRGADGTMTNVVQTAHRPHGVCEAGDVLDRHDYSARPQAFSANPRRISFLGECGGLNLKVPGHLWNGKGHFGYETASDRAALQKAYAALAEHLRAQIPFGLGGFIYTQTTDVEIETNGLLTYDRRVLKVDPAQMKAVNERLCLSDCPAADAATTGASTKTGE